jgi:N-formylglutamate amidohydrolase
MMHDNFAFHEGSTPLLISVPHDGRQLPEDIAALMTAAGRSIPDTDWHVARLYEFARDAGASVLVANYSRYVVDLNRSADDEVLYPGQLVTGLCPGRTFAGADIYSDGRDVDAAERQRRVTRYWKPYHDKLQATLESLQKRHGHALLWDAHSIPSKVPGLFEGELPVLNIGTWDGRSCAAEREQAAFAVARDSGYSSVLNGRFKGGYITRHYGAPRSGVHALQLEIAQRSYMHEDSGAFDATAAARLQATLRAMLAAFDLSYDSGN